MASGAPLWLLDEPLNGLDREGPSGSMRPSRPSRRAGGAVLAASHMPLGGEWRDAGARPMIGALIAREVRRGLHGAAWLPVAFFLLVATIVPFAVGPDARLLAGSAAGRCGSRR
jgi:hypothetical protein